MLLDKQNTEIIFFKVYILGFLFIILLYIFVINSLHFYKITQQKR